MFSRVSEAPYHCCTERSDNAKMPAKKQMQTKQARTIGKSYDTTVQHCSTQLQDQITPQEHVFPMIRNHVCKMVCDKVLCQRCRVKDDACVCMCVCVRHMCVCVAAKFVSVRKVVCDKVACKKGDV